MNTIFRIESISQLHDLVGHEKPKHPLITLLKPSQFKTYDPDFMKQSVVSDLYSISLKSGDECQILYGRQPYDFQEGTLMFLAPNQVITPVREPSSNDISNWQGWILLFHPDLIRKSHLADKMKAYTFFSYETHEALHVSDREKQTIINIVDAIENEFSGTIDDYSQELIISNLELLLNYCKRFYGRQFITRSMPHKEVIVRFESFLRSYFESDRLETQGMPSVRNCARAMGYSPNYLSDLLKKETGKSTQDHIYFHLIEKAKNLLLGTEEPIYRIAYCLGFEYPQHFSKLFKNKTGKSPDQYRN